jgi:hypothetical protein
MPGNVGSMLAVRFDRLAQLHETLIQIAEIDSLFPEAGGDKRGGVVLRHVKAVYPFVGVYGFLACTSAVFLGGPGYMIGYAVMIAPVIWIFFIFGCVSDKT